MDINEIKKRVSIIDYARQLGFTPMKIGSFYTLKEHDSVRIDPRKNLFIQNSTGKGGSVIDFALTFTHMTMAEVIKSFTESDKMLVRKYKVKNKEELSEKLFELPKHDKTKKNVFAYLINTRKLDKDIVSEMVKNKMLYQDEHKNCIFVSYKDEIPVFACKRGTNTYKKFIADVVGSDYEYCFFLDNNAAALLVTESVIDTLSLMSIKKADGEVITEFNYLALAGTAKWEKTISYHLSNRNYSAIYLALDNDTAGKKATKEIIRFLHDLDFQGEINLEVSEEKDWNEQLLKEME